MNDHLRNDLRLIRHRIELLRSARECDEAFDENLDCAIIGIERALDTAGGCHIDDAHPEEVIDGIDTSLAELRIRLDTRSDAWIDDPAMRANLPLADHLLAQACALLTDD